MKDQPGLENPKNSLVSYFSSLMFMQVECLNQVLKSIHDQIFIFV